MKSTLFISDITTVDHAVLMEDGRIKGNSFNLGAYVTGEVTEDEKVVEDFGTVKKRIKQFIDAKEDGYDHKLWIPDPEGILEQNHNRYVRSEGSWSMSLPRDAIKFVEFSAEGMNKDRVEKSINSFLKRKMPHLDFKVFTNIVPRPAFPASKDRPVSMFRYTHGLKDSTSWGCQNILHGHLSFIYLQESGDPCANKAYALQAEIASHLDNIMFIKRGNLYPSGKENLVKIQYMSRDRGEFEYMFRKGVNDFILLETETTIEYLAEFVRDFWARDLKKCAVKKIYLSEGLVKGAVTEINV